MNPKLIEEDYSGWSLVRRNTRTASIANMKPRESRKEITIYGIDLAWGNRNPDGICCLEANHPSRTRVSLYRTHGDESLRRLVRTASTPTCLLAIDAPLICPNSEGARPVDRETHRVFGRFKCGCYPANTTLCPRPPRVRELFEEQGFVCSPSLPPSRKRSMIEVYPHTAIVRWFRLAERIPYKKGRREDRRSAFRQLQSLLLDYLEDNRIEIDKNSRAPLEQDWTKALEDQVDALICALVGLEHWSYQGQRSQVLGDIASGFLVTPSPRSS